MRTFVNRGLIILALNSWYCWEDLLLRWGWMYFRNKENFKIYLWVCWVPKTNLLKEWACQLTNWSFLLLSKNSMTYKLGTSPTLSHFILTTMSYYEWVIIFRNWCTEKLNEFSRVTHLSSGWARQCDSGAHVPKYSPICPMTIAIMTLTMNFETPVWQSQWWN